MSCVICVARQATLLKSEVLPRKASRGTSYRRTFQRIRSNDTVDKMQKYAVRVNSGGSKRSRSCDEGEILTIRRTLIILWCALSGFAFMASGSGQMGGNELSNRSATSGTPAGNRFIIHTPKGDVAVIDFRKHPVSVTEDRQTVVIEDKKDFQIVFNVADTSFVISINVKPFPLVRKQGEAAFLKDLGISQNDACKLSAYEGTTMRIDPRYAGQPFGLSFCKGTRQPSASAGSPKG